MNNLIPITGFRAEDADAALTVSPEVADAAQSERSEFEARFERIRELARVAKAAQDASTAFFAATVFNCPLYGSDEYVRHEMAKASASRRASDAAYAYRVACDEFFLNRDERGRS